MKRIALIALMAPTLALAQAPNALEEHKDCIALVDDAYRILDDLDKHALAIERSSKAGNMTEVYSSRDDVARDMKAYISSLSETCEAMR